MKLVKKGEEELDLFYWCHDRWMEDISHFIKDEYSFEVSSNSTETLMDRLCAHILHWLNSHEGDDKTEAIKSEIENSEEIKNVVFDYSIITPETIVLNFDGISVYELNVDDIHFDKSARQLSIPITDETTLVLTDSEFEEIGGEIMDPENEDEHYEFYFSPFHILLFISEDNEQRLQSSLLAGLKALNKIYASHALEQIVIH